jgi:hypothetical protein
MVAASVFWSSRLFVSSLMSHIHYRNGAGSLEIIGTVRFLAQDETPLKLRVPEAELPTAAHLAVASKAASAKKTEKRTCNVYQSEARIGVVLRHRGSIAFLDVPLVTPLLVANSGKAECIAQVMSRSTDLAMWETVASTRGTLSIDVSSSDSAAPNLKYERSVMDSSKGSNKLRLHLVCEVHHLSNTQGRAYEVVAQTISGQMACTLSMGESGATGTFRKCLGAALRSSVVAYPCGPPPADDPRIRRRDALLDLCISRAKAGMKRRRALEADLHSDLESLRIEWYAGRETTDCDLDAWAERVAANLFPAGWEIFPRHRWLTKASSIQEAALLAMMHGLLTRTIRAYVPALHGAPIAVQVPDLWDAGEPIDSDDEMPLDRPRCPNSSNDWAEFNQKQRGDTRRFGESSPGPELIVACLVLKTTTRLMNSMQSIASSHWEEQQQFRAMTAGEPIVTRLQIAQEQLFTSKFFREVEPLLHDAGPWELLLPRKSRTFTLCSKAFAMLMRASGGISHLLHRPHTGYPFKLFALLGEQREQVLTAIEKDPECLKDDFSRDFLGHFAGRLLSEESRAMLLAVSIGAHIEICRLECRHATVRRLLRGRNQTWAKPLTSVSTDFVLLRQRLLESASRQQPQWMSEVGPVRAKEKHTKGGGGGAFRAYCSRQLSGKPRGTKEERQEAWSQMCKEYRELREKGGEEWLQLLEQGECGKKAHRVGAPSFGITPYDAQRQRKQHALETVVASEGVIPAPPGGETALALMPHNADVNGQIREALHNWSQSQHLPDLFASPLGMEGGGAKLALVGVGSFQHLSWAPPATALSRVLLSDGASA